jgi:predicted MFS family arabinose efflux permease
VPQERTKALGWLTAATSAGVMIGPAIGSISTYLGPQAPGYLAAGLCLLNAVFAWKWLPEPKREGPPHHEVHAAPAPRQSLWRAVLEVLARPAGPVSSLIWVYTIGMMGFMAMNGVLVLYLNRVFGVTAQTIGYFYAYVGGISLVMRGILLGPAVRRFGEVGVTRLGALSLAVGLFAIPLPSTLLGLAVCVLFVPVGTALLFPATTSLVSRRARRSETGQVMGVQQLFGGVSRMLGPLWAGLVFQTIGMQYPFWIAAALMLGVTFLTLRMENEVSPAAPVGEVKPS